jgi:hypothetical protein
MAAPTTGTLTRLDGSRTVTVQAGIREGVQADKIYAQITAAMEEAKLDQYGIRWKLAGEDAEQAEAGAFLSKAFGAAIFLIFIVLLAQFNNFTSVWLVLSAVIMSTIGVLLGLMIMASALHHGDDGDRDHRARGGRGEQQHCADRYLRHVAPRRPTQDRGNPADLPRTRTSCGLDRNDCDLGRAAHRLRAEP